MTNKNNQPPKINKRKMSNKITNKSITKKEIDELSFLQTKKKMFGQYMSLYEFRQLNKLQNKFENITPKQARKILTEVLKNEKK